MNRLVLAALFSLLLPASSCLFAGRALAAKAPASFLVASPLLATSSAPGNAYVAGTSIVITAPVAGDLSAIGGDIVAAAHVAGDELLFAGSIDARAPVAGDLRAVGGSIRVEKPITGDLVALGFSVYDSGRVGGSVFVAAVNAALTGGAEGSVTVYGNTVSLAGDFAGDVRVVAGGPLTLAPDTTIRGRLSYQTPEAAHIPASVTIAGGIEYESVSYLPAAGTSRALAFVSVGLFLLVRILGALILAGLLTGLFPRLAEEVTDRAYAARARDLLLATLLGFAILAATPILIILLLLTFVGIGIALLIIVLYALVVFLALLYAGILLGSSLARWSARRTAVFWHDGVLGMLALSLIALVPIVGLATVFVLTAFSAGVLLQIFFRFAFPHDGQALEEI